MNLSNILMYWQNFINKSTNRKIFGAALVVAATTVLVNLASIGKQLVIAWKFGTGDDIEAFLIALLIPSLLVNVIGDSFNAAFIPTYIQVKQLQGTPASQKLLSGVNGWSSVLLVLATIIMLLTAPVYLRFVAGGFGEEKLHLTFQLLCIISTTVVFSGTLTIWRAGLNAGERFAYAALTPTITPILSIFLLLAMPSWGIYAVAVGLVGGSILELTALGIALKRQGVSLMPKFNSFDANLRQVAAQYVPMVAGAFLMSSTTLVDQSMAAMLSPGSVAALNYGNRLISLPMGLATTALSTAVTPYFSQMVAVQDWSSVRNTLKKYLFWIFLISVPLTGIFVLLSHPITAIVFQRGSFTSDDTNLVSQIQSCYALQIPFYIGGIFVVRLISALKCNHILMWAAVLNLLLNIFFNFILMNIIGAAGIALSTSLVYMGSFSFILFYLHQKIQCFDC